MNEARVSARRRAGSTTARLRHRFVVAARGAGGAARRGAAVRTGTHLAGVGGAAYGAEADRARVPALHVRALVSPAEHELLGADANAITLRQLDRPTDSDAVHAASVAALQVFDDGAAVIDDDARKLIYEKVSSSVLRNRAREMGMRTLREDGVRKVLAGLTTPDEVIRATVGDSE